MKTLFISTYNELITIGLLINNQLVSKKEKISNRNHSIYTVPLIDEVLKDNNMIPKDLNEIIVINGPGSFTGVRLGITVAKTLGYTLNIPVKVISSIEALAVSDNIVKDKIIVINDSKGKYYGIFKSNKLIEINYLSLDDFDLIINKDENQKLIIIEAKTLDLEAICKYCNNIESTPAHAVKALYIKELSGINDI